LQLDHLPPGLLLGGRHLRRVGRPQRVRLGRGSLRGLSPGRLLQGRVLPLADRLQCCQLRGVLQLGPVLDGVEQLRVRPRRRRMPALRSQRGNRPVRAADRRRRSLQRRRLVRPHELPWLLRGERLHGRRDEQPVRPRGNGLPGVRQPGMPTGNQFRQLRRRLRRRWSVRTGKLSRVLRGRGMRVRRPGHRVRNGGRVLRRLHDRRTDVRGARVPVGPPESGTGHCRADRVGSSGIADIARRRRFWKPMRRQGR